MKITGGDATDDVMTANTASVLHFPAKANNLVTIVVTAADGTTTKTYKINTSNVQMAQPELLTFAPNKFSTAGGDMGVAYVKHGMIGGNCGTEIRYEYTYKNSNGETRTDSQNMIQGYSLPDKDGVIKYYLQSWGPYNDFRNAGLVADVRVNTSCSVGDPQTDQWRSALAESTLKNAITYYNPTVTSVDMPDTLSQHSVIFVRGPGMNGDGYFSTYLLNPATGNKLWIYANRIDENSFMGYVSGWDWQDDWRSAKTLKLVVEQYDDEEVKDPVILYSKDVKFTPEGPTQVAFTPAKGPLAGGNTVKVTGHHLSNWDREAWPIIKIGGQDVSNLTMLNTDWQSQYNAMWGSASGKQYDQLERFSFTVPPGVSAGSADITIDIGYGPIPISNKYVYGDKPTVTSITPSTVSNAGGSMITFVGTNFGTSGTPTVTIDGQKSPYVVRVSATKVLAMVPAGTNTGAVDVNLISSSGGGALDTPATITLAAPSANPTITKLTPATAGVSGGDVVTISGTGFSTTATGVTFGGVPAKVTAATATELTVEVPTADVAGVVAVAVGTPTGLTTKANAFTYTATPGVTSVTPSSIKSTDTGAATKVVIDGIGFGAKGTIAVGSAKAVAYTSTAGGTRISGITIPTGTVGSVSVSITPAGAKVPFTTSVAVTGPVINYVGPDPYDSNYGIRNPFNGNGGSFTATAKVSGGTKMRVQGTGFGTAGKVKIGTVLVTPTSYSDTAITFDSPALAIGTYDLTVVPSTGTVTAKQAASVIVGAEYTHPAITTIESNEDNGRSAPLYTFDPANDSSDLFTVTGIGFASTDNGASTKVVVQSETGADPVTVTPVSVTNTSVVFHAPRNMPGLHWVSVKVQTKTSYAIQRMGIYYFGVAQQANVMSPSWGLCTKDAIGTYTPSVITATGGSVFGSSGVVKLGGVALPAGAVTWSDSQVTVDLGQQTTNLADPWGQKTISFTPDDSSLNPLTWVFNCSVQTNVTTKLNNSTGDLTLAAGTSFTASASMNNELPGSPFSEPATGYQYQSAADHAAGNGPRMQNVRDGLPVAAGDWYVWANIGAATWDRVKYNYVSNANDVHVVLTGNPVTFTPKLTAGAGTSITYRGQLGDGTSGSTNDISYTKTATADAVTSVTWQYRNHQCSIQYPDSGWSNGLPRNVAISPGWCGGDDTTVTSWDIRVAGFQMISGGVDKSIYYLPTYNVFNLTITKKALTLSAVKAEKVYDGTNSVTLGEITVSGAIDGDVPTLDPSFAAGAAFANPEVGASKPVTLSGPFQLSSGWAANYNLANSNLVVTGTIRKADAIVRLDSNPGSMIIGTTNSVALTVTVNDSRGGVQIAAANAPAPTLTNKTPAVCSLSGTTVTAIKGGDCIIQATQPASVDYNAAVSYRDDASRVEELLIKVYPAPKLLSVVADDMQVTLGDPLSPSYTMTGLLDGDSYQNVTFSYYQGTTLLSGEPTAIGTYKVVPAGGSLAAVESGAYNPTIKYVAGKLLITAAPPVITASSPAHGPEAGGNTLVITGTGFGAVTSITIGDITLRKPKFVVNGTGTSISLKMPKGVGGVSVVLNAGNSQVSTEYIYDAPPVITSPLAINLVLDLASGVKLAGQKVTITGSGLKANSDYTLVMHSSPVVIYKSVSDSNGKFTQVLTIPAKACLVAGQHTLVLTGTSPDGKAVTSTGYFTLDDSCVVGAQAVQAVATKSWTLSGFLFDFNNPKLNDGGYKSLKLLASVIKGAKTVTIYGYTETDTKSDAIKKLNIILAQGRCDSVVAFLKSLGIKAVYKTVAKGGVDPVSTTDQSKNRRVVITATY